MYFKRYLLIPCITMHKYLGHRHSLRRWSHTMAPEHISTTRLWWVQLIAWRTMGDAIRVPQNSGKYTWNGTFVLIQPRAQTPSSYIHFWFACPQLWPRPQVARATSSSLRWPKSVGLHAIRQPLQWRAWPFWKYRQRQLKACCSILK